MKYQALFHFIRHDDMICRKPEEHFGRLPCVDSHEMYEDTALKYAVITVYDEFRR